MLRLSALIFLLTHGVSAFGLNITIKDSTGQPVPNAIVSLSFEQPVQVSGYRGSTPAVMDQQSKQFVPHVLLIRHGQSVSFPNSDNIRHHVYSFSDPKRFEIKLYADTPKEPILFDKAGVVALGCNIHDGMIGYIYVSPWATSQKTDAEGETVLAYTESVIPELSVWHPNTAGSSQTVVFKDVKVLNSRVELTIDLKKPSKPKIQNRRWR